MNRKMRIAFVLCIAFAAATHADELRIELTSKTEPSAQIVLKGLPAEIVAKLRASNSGEDATSLLRVFAVVDGKPAASPMSGDTEIQGNAIVFTPRYPLRSDVTYRVVFDPSTAKDKSIAGLSKIEHDLKIQLPAPTEATRLTEIFPSGDVLPENLLRVYLYFSAPMSRGEAYQRIHLIDEKGKAVVFPFLELSEELWSPDGKRFTLYFDPGRIKRGLKPREELGPALIEGGKYSLVVDAEWSDANGRPLKDSFTKTFRVAAPDDKQPNPQHWKIQPPKAGSRHPVVVALDEPLDSGMLQRVLEIRTSTGKVVPGEIRLSNHEQRWEFLPDREWGAGQYRLIAFTGLEDLAGNSIRRLLEIDVLIPAPPDIDTQVVELPFTVGK